MLSLATSYCVRTELIIGIGLGEHGVVAGPLQWFAVPFCEFCRPFIPSRPGRRGFFENISEEPISTRNSL